MSFPESSPQVTRWCALFMAIVFSIAAALTAYELIRAEASGVATYKPGRYAPAEVVRRSHDPRKFHDAKTGMGYQILYTGCLASIGFYFFRRLSD
jgi:hypothetical protein